MKRVVVLSLFVAGALGMMSTPVRAASGAAANATGKFVLDGTATIVKEDGASPTNFLLAIDTSTPGQYGVAWRQMDSTVADLTGQLQFDYEFVSGSDGGGSPRITLGVDTDGDGVADGYINGYAGDPPNFTGDPTDTWLHADLAEAGSPDLRWDLTQLGGSFYSTWDDAVALLGSDTVVEAGLVADSSWMATAAGLSLYDNVQIGDRTLTGPQDILGK